MSHPADDPLVQRIRAVDPHGTGPDDPVEEVAAIISDFYELDGNAVGGSLHIALDDFNLDDRSLWWCAGYAAAREDTVGYELANLLAEMDVVDRVDAVRGRVQDISL